MNINYLWHKGTHDEWIEKEKYYWELIKPNNLALEKEMEQLDYRKVEVMTAEEFYDFLYNKYFLWKFTAPNRLATTRRSLEKHKLNINELVQIKAEIFLNRNNISNCIKSAKKINGLGTAGASGLLALMFPNEFATVGQFLVKALQQVDNIEYKKELLNMSPESLKSNDGIILIKIMQEKAKDLNSKNKIEYWTPRKIDKVLWCIGR